MEISEHYDEISHCNRCGFCQVACPIFRSTGHEDGVARGRLALLRAIIEGRLEWNQEVEGPLFDCLLCGASYHMIRHVTQVTVQGLHRYKHTEAYQRLGVANISD